MAKKKKPWSGRFDEQIDAFVEEFTASIPYDVLLYRHDIAGSIAHARMLGRQKIIPQGEAKRIIAALTAIREEIGSTFPRKTFIWRWSSSSPGDWEKSGGRSTPAGAGTTRWRWTCGCTCEIRSTTSFC
jgi:hypothetical protein